MNDLQSQFLASAQGIFESSSGVDALSRCQWDPAVDTGDPSALAALGSLFRAHGRTLAVTPALGMLAATALVGHEGDTGTRTGVFNARRDGERVQFVCLGGLVGDLIVVDLPGEGVFGADARVAVKEQGIPLEPAFAHLLSVPATVLEPLGRTDGGTPPTRPDTLVRLAVAHELLGVCDVVMGMATEYATVRSQFGRPIGSFQAVQHLLADAVIDVRGLEAACRLAVGQPLAGGEGAHLARYLKALAGRSTGRVLQATLQTLGAIGFTWEHDHHRFTRRALTLDAIGETADDLVRDIGRRARGDAVWRPVPSF